MCLLPLGDIQLNKKFLADPVQSWPAVPRSRLLQDEDALVPALGGEDPAVLPVPETAMECAARAKPGQCWSFKGAEVDGHAECNLYDDCDGDPEEQDGYISGKSTADGLSST